MELDLMEERINEAKEDPMWMQMFSGIRFWCLNPDINSILLPDIAHALAFQCRFGGHTRKFYSVAQHCMLVSQLTREDDVELKLAGLLHDATEAYLVDLPRPIKYQMPIYKETEDKLAIIIGKRFNVDPAAFKYVKKYDEEALSIEARSLMAPMHPAWYTTSVQKMIDSPVHIEKYFGPEEAEAKYLELFNELWMQRK